MWLSLLSSCIHHSSSDQRPLHRCTSTRAAVLTLPWKRLICQAVLPFLLKNAASTASSAQLSWFNCIDVQPLQLAQWTGQKTLTHPWWTQWQNYLGILALPLCCCKPSLFPFLQAMAFPVIKIQFFVKKWHRLVLPWRSAPWTWWKSGLGSLLLCSTSPAKNPESFPCFCTIRTTVTCIYLAKPPV